MKKWVENIIGGTLILVCLAGCALATYGFYYVIMLMAKKVFF